MKINLGNQILNIELTISKKPNITRLTRELSNFFNCNDIEGEHISRFRLEERGKNNYYIIPLEPPFEEALSAGDYQKKIEEIGNKYGIKNLGFVYWCYHK